MSSDTPTSTPESQVPAPFAAASTAPSVVAGPGVTAPSRLLWLIAVIAVAALVASLLVWQRVSSMQQQLALQSADTGTVAVEARTLSRQAQELTRDTAARLSLLEVRVNEVALQRTQLEELMQSMSRSRDENLVVDIEAALRLAQQQAVLTGSVEPLLAALRSASQRVSRAAQPRLNTLQRAIEKDMERIREARVVDIPAILVRLDDVVRLVDDIPVANAPAPMSLSNPKPGSATDPPLWWERLWSGALVELRSLVRVSRIDHPDAMLLSPEQSYFLRENLKLTLLNARLGLLARQPEAVGADLDTALAALGRYFDSGARKTQQAQTVLRQLRDQLKALELPRIDNTLTALAVAVAGR